MKKYIVISPSGYCEDACGHEACHCQMIGTYRAKSKENAIKQARKNLKEWNLEYPTLIVYQLDILEKI